MAARRGEGSLSFEHRGECQDPRYHRGCVGLWRGLTSEVLDGTRVRVCAKTKAEAAARLNAKLVEQRAGVRSSGSYTVRECVDDWLDVKSKPVSRASSGPATGTVTYH